MAKRTRKQKNRDENAALLIGALAIVCQIEHWWGYVALAAGVAASAYIGLRLRRRYERTHTAPPAPRMGRPAKSRTERRSAECAGTDHDICTDRVCNCRCGHPGRTAKREPVPASSAPPLPADDVPPF